MWFDLSSLTDLCDAPTFARGLQLYRAQKVLSIQVQPLDSGAWQVSGHVIGSQRQPYAVEAELALMPDGAIVERWRSECACPVGARCKHAVALLIKSAYQAKVVRGAVELTGAKPQAQSEQSKVQLALQRQRLIQAQQAARWLAATDTQPQVVPSQRGTAGVEFPLYMVYQPVHDSGVGPLRLSLAVSAPKVKGGWSKPKAVAPHYFQDLHLRYHAKEMQLTPTDHEVLSLLGALPAVSLHRSYTTETDKLLNGVAAQMVLTRAASTGRLFWMLDGGVLGPNLSWGPAAALHWSWSQSDGLTPEEPLWRLQASLPAPQAKLCANQPHMWYVNFDSGQCGVVEGGAVELDLLRAPPLPQSVMLQHQVELALRLGDAAPMPPVLPALERLSGSPVWRIHFSLLPEDARDTEGAAPGLMTAQVDFDYHGHQNWWPADAPQQLMVELAGKQVLLARDLASEREAVVCLERLGLVEWLDGVFALAPNGPQTQWLHWVDEQFEPFKALGFEVGMDASLHSWIRRGGDVHIDLHALDAQGQAMVDTGAQTDVSDWFDLSLGIEVEGQRINVLPWLPQLIQSLQGHAEEGEEGAHLTAPHVYLPAPDGRGYVRVATGVLRPWLNALLELFDDHRKGVEGDSLRLSRIDALRVGVALGEGVPWEGGRHLTQLAQQLQGRASLPVVALPAGLKADMRPYQRHGLDWLQFLRAHGLAGILADDMGLGKTLQTLAHLQCEKEAGRLDRPALVVAPVSLLGNWQREAARFCPDLKTLLLYGADRHQRADDMAQVDLVIAPYSLLHRDRERWTAQPWHVLVLDEAQNIKNAHTQAAQVVADLSARHRLCLSGTPIENHLGEIWSLFHFLMPGFLGSQAKFQQRFRNPIEKHGDGQRLAQLRARLTPFILRRTKQLVADELPPKVESVMSVELSGKQADLYETIRLSMEKAVRDAITDKGLAKSQIVFLDALLKLRQVCCDPRLVKTTAAAKVKESAKLEQLMDILPEMLAEGRRVLLFSQFTSMLTLIEKELALRNIPWAKLTGQTQKRDEVIDRFTSGQVPLFLISLKAGGVGLNLPQADTVIHFDPWWNPAAENQATDRAHRIGQTQSVWVIKLVAQGTIEERILALQSRKAELAKEIYSGSAGRKQPLFTEEDVLELLKPVV